MTQTHDNRRGGGGGVGGEGKVRLLVKCINGTNLYCTMKQIGQTKYYVVSIFHKHMGRSRLKIYKLKSL